jgi:hypothetical protein
VEVIIRPGAKVLTKRKVTIKITTWVKLQYLNNYRKENFFFLNMHRIHNMMHMDSKVKVTLSEWHSRHSSQTASIKRWAGVFKEYVLANFCFLWTFANTISGIWKKTHEKDLNLSRGIMQLEAVDIPIINNPKTFPHHKNCSLQGNNGIL